MDNNNTCNNDDNNEQLARHTHRCLFTNDIGPL